MSRGKLSRPGHSTPFSEEAQRAQCIYRPEVKVHVLHTASEVNTHTGCEFTTLVHQIKSTHPPPSRYYFSSQSPLNHEDPHTCAGGPSAVLCGTVWGYLSRVVATLAAMRHRGLSACSARGSGEPSVYHCDSASTLLKNAISSPTFLNTTPFRRMFYGTK